MTEERELVQGAIQTRLLTDLRMPAPANYELVRSLGSGGGGVVWLARDRGLQRDVAIKFLSDASPADVERFRREARFAARLKSPAVVQVYELGEAQGQPYIAMQFVDGPDLGRADLERPALVKVLRTIADALRHAHTEGIVHRDIKPQNILLDREGRAYLTDFGVARDLKAPAGATLTSDGMIVGTPALMSPEQARGDPKLIDLRTDVYALGATLFWKLTGRPPFDGSSLVDVLHAVLYQPPPFPRSFDPSIPRGLEAITLKCLQKSPADRYRSMAELIEDFDLHLAGRPVKSESEAWFRKLVGAAPPVVSEPPDPDVPVVLEIARELSAWDANLYRVSSNVPRLFPQLDALVARLDGLLAARPDFALARFHRGLALFRRGRLQEALDDLERTVDRVDHGSFEVGKVYLAIAFRELREAKRHVHERGRRIQTEEARRRFRQAVVAFQEAECCKESASWQRDYARAAAKLADGAYDACAAECERILEADPDLEEVWLLRAEALRFAMREPWECYDRAVSVRRSYYDAWLSRGEAHLERAQLAPAREAFARAQEIRPDLAEPRVALGRILLQEGKPAEAAAIFREIHDDYEAAVSLAEAHLAQGDATHAIDALEVARKIPGCHNRVSLRMAEAQLLRGDVASARRIVDGVPAEIRAEEPWKALAARLS